MPGPRSRVVGGVVVALCAAGAAAGIRALPRAHAETAVPGTVMSSNLEHLGVVPGTGSSTSANFLTVDGTPLMLTTGRYGLKVFDLSDAAHPRLLSTLLPSGITAASSDLSGGFYENEDMDVDPVRKLVFLSRDPRSNDASSDNGESGIYAVSVSDPAHPRELSYVKVPAGHTTTCIDRCRWLWTGGPARDVNQPADWGGRPIWVTDMRDPSHPRVLPQPIDLWRNDGKTDYSHDVQVDAEGIAWTSGRGGVLGYRTANAAPRPRPACRPRRSRRCRRAALLVGVKRRAVATPADPVGVAGGGITGVAIEPAFMHNSLRVVGAGNPIRTPSVKPGNLLIATEESFAATDGDPSKKACVDDGRLTINDLSGSWRREGFASRPARPFRLRSVATWSPSSELAEASVPLGALCSSHYFEQSGSLLATTWYQEGLRFLDLSDAAHPRQVAYYRAIDSVAFAAYLRHGLIYLVDLNRGVEVLRFVARPSAASPTVKAPPLSPATPRFIPAGGLQGDLVCPLLRPAGQAGPPLG